MSPLINELDQPVGDPVPSWTGRPRPTTLSLSGRYRRQTDALNAHSRAAAIRLGFRYEGTFRQALVVKGRNRDTAWYSIIDTEWPLVEARLHSWLTSENFDERGTQKAPLGRSP